MSRIEQLIEELCPDGVEWKRVGECLVRTKGTPITAQQMSLINKVGAPIKIFAGGKTVAFVDYGDIPEKDILTKESIVVKSRGVIQFEYIDKPFSHKNEFWSYHSDDENINIKYVYYFLKNKEEDFQSLGERMSKMPQLSIPDTDKYAIPIPPLPIQQEIVSILDTFTSLDASLQTELEARRKQYEHYRDQLLSFEGKEVEWKVLGDVCDIYDGTHQTPKYTNEGVRFVSVENIKSLYDTKKYISRVDYDNLYKIKPQLNDVFMTRIGSIGACAIVDRNEELAYYVTLTLLRPNQQIVQSKYVRFYIESSIGQSELRKRTLINAVPIKINLGEIGKIKIPLPSLSEQHRIVSILDKFDALVNTELPAEIAARRKQYEYYREKLLTFKPLKN
jgi:type I restriction enzyme S subunit